MLTDWGGPVGVFSDSRQVVVPCGALPTWQADPAWSQFTNLGEPGVPQLTVNADEHGGAEVVTLPTCGNDTATVSATATEAHYHFSHWSDGSTQNPYILVLNGNTDLTAYFAIDSATVSVATADATKGSVLGGGTVPLGGTATITAIPTEDNVFLAWSNGVTANPYTLTVTSDTSLTAHFSQPDTVYVQVHDTTYIDVHDTTYIEVHDTTYESVYDIEYVDRYIHDTTFVNTYVHDTTIQYVNQYVHDTTLVSNYVHDTTIQYVNQYVFDTVYLNNNIHDTLVQYVNQYVHDTTYVNNYLHDTIRTTTQRFDTTIVNLYQFDTAIYNTYHFDTLIVNNHYYDTVFVHLHDTIYITQEGIGGVDGLNAKVYSSRGQIVVEGAEGNTVMLSDVTGRILATKQDDSLPLRFDAPASGTYMIKIGNYPARKIVVIR